jgi:hypothetical protein
MIAVRFGPIENAKAARLLLYGGTAPLQLNYIFEHDAEKWKPVFGRHHALTL